MFPLSAPTLLCLITLCFSSVAHVAFSQSRMPKEDYNYIAITGSGGVGSIDRVNVVFFEVPDTLSSTLYFAVYDPGVDDVAPDRGTTGTTTFSLIGGSGSLSDSRSRQWEYTDAEILAGEHIVGNLLDSVIHGNDSIGWVYFQGVLPSQGEHLGSKYYFKISAEADLNVDKNAYQLWISYGNSGIPTGINGVRTFAYSWCLALGDQGHDFEIYPFIQEGESGYIVYSNFDFDEGDSGLIDTTGTAYNKSEGQARTTALVPGITESLNGVLANTSYQITAGEDNGTWLALYNEGTGLPGSFQSNPGDIWFWNSPTPVNDTTSLPPNDSVVYRAYAGYFSNPTSPNHVSLSWDDGVAEADNVDTEMVVLQIVDSLGNPTEYSRDIYVTVDNSGNISEISAGTNNGTNALITTDGTGIGYLRVRKPAPAGNVTVRAYWDGTGGSDSFGSMTSDSLTINFLINPDPTISSSGNKTFSIGAPPTVIPQLGIQDSPSTAQITAVNNIRISIPLALNCEFNTTITDFSGVVPTRTVTVAGGGAVDTSVSYIDSRTLLIDVTTSFSPGAQLDISGLEFQTFSAESSGRLRLSFDGGTSYSSVDDKVYSIVDNNPPTILSRRTGDLNGNGFIDAIRIIFSKNIDDATVNASDFDVGGVTGESFASNTGGDTPQDNDIYITFNDGVLDTGQIPTLIYSQGTLADPAGNLLLSSGPTVCTDGAVPIVTNVDSSTADGTYGAAAVIIVNVSFSELVNVTGAPRLLLETGTVDRYALYNGGSGSSVLIFSYTVQSGDVSADLDYTGTGALELNGGSVRDTVGNDSDLTLPAPGFPGSLGANRALVIDTGAPPLSPGKVIIRNNIINPSRGEITTINFRLTKPMKVTITVYDLNGDPVRVLYNRTALAGLNETVWDGRNKKGKAVVQGVYFVVVKIGKERYVRKVLVLG